MISRKKQSLVVRNKTIYYHQIMKILNKNSKSFIMISMDIFRANNLNANQKALVRFLNLLNKEQIIKQ